MLTTRLSALERRHRVAKVASDRVRAEQPDRAARLEADVEARGVEAAQPAAAAAAAHAAAVAARAVHEAWVALAPMISSLQSIRDVTQGRMMPGMAPIMIVCLWVVPVKDRCMKP